MRDRGPHLGQAELGADLKPARTFCHFPVTVQVTGTLTDEQLSQLAAHVEQAVGERLAAAERETGRPRAGHDVTVARSATATARRPTGRAYRRGGATVTLSARRPAGRAPAAASRPGQGAASAQATAPDVVAWLREMQARFGGQAVDVALQPPAPWSPAGLEIVDVTPGGFEKEAARAAAQIRARERMGRTPTFKQSEGEIDDIMRQAARIAADYRTLIYHYEGLKEGRAPARDPSAQAVLDAEDDARSLVFLTEEAVEKVLANEGLLEPDAYQKDKLQALGRWLTEMQAALDGLASALAAAARIWPLDPGEVRAVGLEREGLLRSVSDLHDAVRAGVRAADEQPDISELLINAIVLAPFELVFQFFMGDAEQAARIERLRQRLRPFAYRSPGQHLSSVGLEQVFAGLVDGIALNALTGVRAVGGARALAAAESAAESAAEIARLRALFAPQTELEAALGEMDRMGDALMRYARTASPQEAAEVAARVQGGQEVIESLRGELREYRAATSGAITGEPPARPGPGIGGGTVYDRMSLDELRRLAPGNVEAADALGLRYEAMSDEDLSALATQGDATAAHELAQRPSRPAELLARRHGPSSDPAVFTQLTERLRAARKLSGIPRRSASAVWPGISTEGGTMGVAITDAPAETTEFVGRSPRAGGVVNPQSEFAPATDPVRLAHTYGHAEQDLADQLDAALSGLSAEQRQGKTVWMLIEQEVCSTCAQGIHDPALNPGVLRKLSQKYPDVTFEIKNADSSRRITLLNGREL